MSVVDRFFRRFGLMRISQHESVLDAHDRFTYALAAAVGTEGVTVLTGKTQLTNSIVDGPLFLMGDDNFVAGCFVRGTIFKHPRAERTGLHANTLAPKQPTTEETPQ